MILLILICYGPGGLWLDASSQTHWSEEHSFQLQEEQAMVSSYGVLPNPLLQLSYSGSPIETRNGPLLGSIGLQQRIPWPGLLSSSERKANAKLAVAEDEIFHLGLQMRTSISKGWAEVYKREQLGLLAVERAEYLASLLVSAAGSSSTLAMEHSALVDLRIRVALSEQRPLIEHNLLVAAHGELQALTGTSFAVVDELPPVEWFLEKIASTSAEPYALRIALGSVALAEAELSRIKSAGMPDFTVGASYTAIGIPKNYSGAVSDEGRDSWTVSLGISLPLGYSGDEATRQAAEFHLAQTMAHYSRLEEEITAELDAKATILVNCVYELDLLFELLPLSESAVLSASQAWIAGGGSYSTLVSTLENNLEIHKTIIEKEALLVVSAAEWLELAGADTDEGDFL